MFLTFAVELPAQDYTYTVDNGAVTITGFTGSNGVAVITNMIGGLPVTGIGSYAFFNCADLTGVTIPDSVTQIGTCAFEYCAGLTNVTIPEGVTNVGEYAFDGCSNLAVVMLGTNVASIGDGAFSSCARLTGITIPASVTSIGNWAFSDSCLTNLTIPASVTHIGDWAFFSCSNLSNVTIPNSVAEIRSYVFKNCAGLTSVTIPDSVTNIADCAFDSCSSLTNVVIGNGVTRIGSEAFFSCAGLTNILIPTNVTRIGDEAFANCGLASFIAPHGLTNIGNTAFYDCGDLTRVSISDSVTRIGYSAFQGCVRLSAITVDALNPSYSSLDGVLFDKNMATLIQCPGACVGNYTVPDGVTSLGEGAFAECPGLTNLTIPRSVFSIGDSIFSGSDNLTAIYFQGTVPRFGAFVFDANSKARVYYTSGTRGWGATFCGRPTVPVPRITSQPRNSSVIHGVNAAFHVTLSGKSILNYQWLRNGVRLEDDARISGTRSPALVLRQVRLEDQGLYSVVISTANFSIFSRKASLSVIADLPKLQLSTSASDGKVNDAVLSITGRASDRLGIDQVRVRANNGPWVMPSTTNHWTNWSATLALDAPGPYWIVAQATDLDGALGSVSNRIEYVKGNGQLSVKTTSGGSVSPNYNNSILEIGSTHSITARPESGFVFSNWTGGVFPDSAIMGNAQTLTFVMKSNLVLQANFVPNPFPRATGSFAGLFYNTNNDGLTVSNAGYFTAKVTSNGIFSAKLQQGARAYSLSGQFAADGNWQSAQIKNAPGLSVSLLLDLENGETLTGNIESSVWTAGVVAHRVTHSKINPAPQAGHYTLVIPGSVDSTNLPGGCGAFAAQVDSLGVVSVCGNLGDGEPVTAASAVSSLGQWPFYSAPYGKRGILIGWLTFTNNSSVGGQVSWIKPGQPGAKMYPAGFDWPCDISTNSAFGSALQENVGWPNWANGVAILEGGNLAQSATNWFRFDAAKQLMTTNGMTLSWTTTGAKAGLFSGKAVAGRETKKINGAYLQNQNIGLGWFLGTNQSGSVRLSADW